MAAPLVLKIADSTGAGVPGVVVTSTVSPEGAATVAAGCPAITLNDGTVTAAVTLGSSARSGDNHGSGRLASRTFRSPSPLWQPNAAVHLYRAGSPAPCPQQSARWWAVLTECHRNYLRHQLRSRRNGHAGRLGERPAAHTNLGGVCVEFAIGRRADLRTLSKPGECAGARRLRPEMFPSK